MCCLPATLYKLAKSMARQLSLPLTLDVSLAPELVQRWQREPRRHKGDNVPAELGLIGAVIVVLKMAYGLDGVKRYVGGMEDGNKSCKDETD
jgi:RNA polymerase I-specific transcription initiation factor RRN7